MNFDPAIVSTVVPAFLVLIIAYYTLGGAIKGFRKSLFRFVSFIIFLAVGYFSMQWVAAFIVEGNGIATISNFVDLSGVIGSATDFTQAVTYLMSNSLGMTPNQDTIEMVGALVSLIIKIVYFIVYVFVIKIVYWLIEKIVWILFFRQSRHYRKNYTMKKRSLGAVVGFGKGLIIAAFFGVAINGFVSIVPRFDFSAFDTSQNQEHQPLSQGEAVTAENILQMLDGMGLRPVFEALDVYRQTRFSQVLTSVKVGEKPIEATVLDAIFTGTYQDFSINGLTELKNLVSIATAAADIYFAPDGFDPMTMDIGNLAPIFNAISQSDLILKLIPIGINYALNEEMLDSLPYGVTIPATAFDGIDWSGDFERMGELATAIGNIGDGTLATFDYLDQANIEIMINVIKNLSIIQNVTPIVVDVALQLPEVQAYVGDLTQEIADINWADELSAFADIYAAFRDLSITSFDAIASDLLGKADTPELRSFFEALFASEFINTVFSYAIETAVTTFFADDPMVGPLISLISFNDITTAQWIDEFMTIISIANDVAPGAELPEMGPAIIANISAEKIAQSQILIRAIKAFVATSYQEDSVASLLGIQEYLKVPSAFQDFNNVAWDADINNDGTLDKDGEVILFIRGLKGLIDAVIPPGGDFDFSTLNPSELIENLTDNLIEDIAGSTLMRAFISNALLPMLEDTGDLLIVPDEIKQSILVMALDGGNNPIEVAHTILRKEEIERLLKAVKSLAGVLFDETGEFSFDMENITALFDDPDLEEGLNYILGSADGTVQPSLILQATISKFLIDMGVDNGGMIVIPSTSLQTTFEINPGEFIPLVSQPVIKGQQMRLLVDIVLDSGLDFANLDTLGLDLISNLVVSVNNGKLGNSDILNATLTQFMLDNVAGVITIPKQVITKTAPGSGLLDTVDFLTKTELENLVRAIAAFGIDDMADIGLDLITSITDDAVWQTIFSSKILQVTVSGFIVDMAEGGSGLIVIPEDAATVDPLNLMTYGAYEASGTFTTLDDNPLEVIRADELRFLIRGINIVIAGLVDTEDGDPNNDTLEDVLASSPLKMVENINSGNITTITESKILYATLSKFILDLDPTITIPGYFGPATTESSGVVLQLGNKFVVDSLEILALLDAFSALGADIDGAIDIASVLARSEAEINTIFASVIVRATATSLLLDLADDGTLSVPGYDPTTQTVVPGGIIDLIASTPVIQAQEYANLVLTAKALGLGDFTDAGIESITVSNLITNQVTIFGTLVGSEYVGGTQIFQATMSKLILDARPSLTIPNQIIHVYSDTVNEYIETGEILALLEALQALGIDGLDSASVNIGVDTLTSLSDANLTTLLASSIMHYTMSVQINDNASSVLTIPSDAFTNTLINDTTEYLLKDAEIKAFLLALGTLDISDASAVGIGSVLDLITLTKDLSGDITAVDSTNISGRAKALLNSKIIWNFVSESITDNSATLTIPLVAYDGVITTRLSKLEIVNMLVSLKALDITTTDSLDVDIADLTAMSTTNLNVVLESNVIYYTMSEKVRTNGTLDIPEDAYTAIFIDGVSGPKLIEKVELTALFAALDTLGIGDPSTVGISAVLDLITLTKDIDDNITSVDSSKIDGDAKALLNSKIIWNFVSESITDNSATLTIPLVAYDSVITTRLSKLEIVNMLVSLKALGITTTDSLDVDIGDLTALSATNLELVLESNIIYYTMSEKVRTNGTLDIPEDAYTTTYINGVDGAKLIEKDELVSFIRALDTLGLSDATAVDIAAVLDLIILTKDIDDNITSVNSSQINGASDAILDSKIIWNYVSKAIADNGTGPSPTLVVPDVVFDGVVTTRITKVEIVKMLVSMKALNITSADAISIDLGDLTGLSETNLNYVLDSTIIYYTMSEKVRTNGTLEIPDDAYTTTYINGVDGALLIQKSELVHFIQALGSLGGDDASDITFSSVIGLIDYTKDLDDNVVSADSSKIADLLDSIIVWHYISEAIVNSTSPSIIIPGSAYDGMISDRIHKLEAEKMLVAMGILGFNDPSNITLDGTTLSALTDIELDLILESDIMWYSISKYFIDNHAAEIAFAGITVHTDGDGIDYIEKADLTTLKNLI